MPDAESGSCLLFESANLIAAGLFLAGTIFCAYTNLVPAGVRSKFWLGILAALIGLAFFSKNVAELMGQLGTVFVAMLAIWNDKLIDFFNPPACEIVGPKRDPKVQVPTLNMAGRNSCGDCDQFHLEIKNLNPSRPLKGVRVSFRRYEVDGVEHSVPVPRQFTWAPHQSEPANAFIPRTKVLDFGYVSRNDKSLSLIIYSGNGRFDGGEEMFNRMDGKVIVFHLEISADNISNPIGQRVTFDRSQMDYQFHIEPEEVT